MSNTQKVLPRSASGFPSLPIARAYLRGGTEENVPRRPRRLGGILSKRAHLSVLLHVLALLALLFAATPSFAEQQRKLARVSASQLKSACDKAGGTFETVVDQFSCQKENCDGKGGICSVVCDGKGCSGSTPEALHGNQTLISLLQNGSMVLHDIEPTPSGSLASPSEATAGAPTAPTAPAPGPLL